MAFHEDRLEHLRLCKVRALEYLHAGDLRNCYSSMVSDLSKHPETAAGNGMIMAGIQFVLDRDADGLLLWVEGFR